MTNSRHAAPLATHLSASLQMSLGVPQQRRASKQAGQIKTGRRKKNSIHSGVLGEKVGRYTRRRNRSVIRPSLYHLHKKSTSSLPILLLCFARDPFQCLIPYDDDPLVPWPHFLFDYLLQMYLVQAEQGNGIHDFHGRIALSHTPGRCGRYETLPNTALVKQKDTKQPMC